MLGLSRSIGLRQTLPAAAAFRRSLASVTLSNPNPPSEPDHFFHLGLGSDDDIKARFGDTKFFCTGGSASRIELFAHKAAKALGHEAVGPIGKTDRYVMYKVGPVLMANHGMGMPTTSILLHEVTKLLSHAGADDPTYIRLGTSGGIGVEAGTTVITTEAMNGMLEPTYTLPVLGEMMERPARIDPSVVDEIIAAQPDGAPVVRGKTCGTDCFYEGQGRLDGAICEYDDDAKMAFLKKAHEKGVRNFEMEAPVFAAFTHRLGIKAAICCVSLIDRLKGDQHYSTPEEIASYDERPGDIVINYIKAKLAEDRKA